MGERVVQKLVKRYREEGEQAIPTPRPRSGRPKVTSPWTVNVLKRQVEPKPVLTARELKADNPRLLGDVSLRTVQRRLHDDLGYRRFRARRKPLLSVKHVAGRVAFCKKYKEFSLAEWRGVLWSDESVFTVTGTSGCSVYRKPGSDPHLPQYTVKTVKHPASLMVWGCFTYHGVGDLVVLPANQKMNQYNYLELLCDELPDAFEKTKATLFMQDGAPCHTAKLVKRWLYDCEVPYFKVWPGNSPDLNPIENLWAILKRRIRDRDTSSVPKLEAVLREERANFPEEILHKLADSLPRRLTKCLKRKGNTTKY